MFCRLLCTIWLPMMAAPQAALQHPHIMMLQPCQPQSPASLPMSALMAQRSLTAQQVQAALPLQRASCTLPTVGIRHLTTLKLTSDITRDPPLPKVLEAVLMLISQLHISCLIWTHLSSMSQRSSSSNICLGVHHLCRCHIRHPHKCLLSISVIYQIRCQPNWGVRWISSRGPQVCQASQQPATSAVHTGQSQGHFPRLEVTSCTLLSHLRS